MKIETPLVVGDVIEIKPNIYAAIIRDDYDRAMLFCRYQEYYESPFPEIRNNTFSLESYMRRYTKTKKLTFFSYPHDWVGYNIPSNILIESHKKFTSHSPNEYDNVMGEIITYCNENTKGEEHQPWYIIGVDKIKSGTMDHEIAHGLYYTNLRYKVEMDYLISQIRKTEYISLGKHLIKAGYVNDKKIIDDEIQAFMSTGKYGKWSEIVYKKYSLEFIKVFKRYNGINK
jgi:hypothetical protein